MQRVLLRDANVFLIFSQLVLVRGLGGGRLLDVLRMFFLCFIFFAFNVFVISTTVRSYMVLYVWHQAISQAYISTYIRTNKAETPQQRLDKRKDGGKDV